tara:strand:- start:1 stop:816 length:816 start_codon:yes stop_codon:yes gene_type:complete
MANTRVTTPVTDFDKATSLPGLKLPSGTNANLPTGVQGMIRNDTDETGGDSSVTAIEHHNGTTWKYFAATESPDVVYPTSLKMFLDASNTTSYPGTGSTWFDLTNNNNNGTISNSTWDPTGYFPFNGSSSQVVINPVTFPSSTYTIEARVRFSTLKTQGVVSWGDGASGERRTALMWNGGSGSYVIYSSTYASNIAAATLVPVTNQWYDIMISMNNGSVTIYIDGISRGTGTNTINSYTSTTAYIGRTEQSVEYLSGDISMVKVSDVALTP